MISFITPTALPIEAATTMGVSVKETDGAIGKFGTGLKYAIAGVLRLCGTVEIFIRGTRHEFTAIEQDIRGRKFRIVHCNGAPCGFTTELGKHWKPWQLFRELASNTLDEGGRWASGNAPANEGATVIRVSCREVEESGETEAVFRPESTCLVRSTMGAQVYAGSSRHYYYKGIRAGSFDTVAPVTVDVTSGELSEDRLLDLSTVQSELSWAFRSATHFDEGLLLSVLQQHDPGDFWVKNTSYYHFKDCELPKGVIAFLAERPKFVMHPGLKMALNTHFKRGGLARWEEVPMTARYADLLRRGEAVCEAVGVDPIPKDKVHFTRDLGDAELAVTCLDTRHVWFSTKLVMLGEGEFLAGYVEEALHAMTGLRDCTREFQNALLAIVVGIGRHDARVAA